MPASFALSWIDLVLAVRQPLSAPTWANPIVIVPSSFPEAEPPSSLPQAVSIRALIEIALAAIRVFFSTGFPPDQLWACAPVTGVTGDECER